MVLHSRVDELASQDTGTGYFVVNSPRPHGIQFFSADTTSEALTLHCNLGDIKLELYCDHAPKACYNFLALSASGYYDESKFHRSIAGFMIQGGDPTGTGKGGSSAFNTRNGKFEDEIVPVLKHDRPGIVSMANSGPNTNGSQFFITYAAHTHLDGSYTIFGHVIQGMDVLRKMEKVATDSSDCPTTDIIISKITIHANPLAEKSD